MKLTSYMIKTSPNTTDTWYYSTQTFKNEFILKIHTEFNFR